MCDHVDKVDLLSEANANNYVTLHKISNPACTTLAAYPCGDHFHVGHSSLTAADRAASAACKAERVRRPPQPKRRR